YGCRCCPGRAAGGGSRMAEKGTAPIDPGSRSPGRRREPERVLRTVQQEYIRYLYFHEHRPIARSAGGRGTTVRRSAVISKLLGRSGKASPSPGIQCWARTL